MLYFGPWPIALLIPVLFIPLVYCIVFKREELKKVALLVGCGVLVVVMYPLVFFLSSYFGTGGYTLAKIILFVLFPAAVIMFIEKWKPAEALNKLGVTRENIGTSMVFGLIAAAVVIVITVLVSSTFDFDPFWRLVMFFEAFTEEFFFRGILFLYLLQKTNRKVAYATSIIGFILIHPQHFTSLFIISTIAQSVLLTIVAHRTKNIMGAWFSHGLNRVVPTLVRLALGI